MPRIREGMAPARLRRRGKTGMSKRRYSSLRANRPDRPEPAGRSHPNRSGRMDSKLIPRLSWKSPLANLPVDKPQGRAPGPAEPPVPCPLIG